ncbi:pyridoxamine 5'-phosphate oxidase family protein [Micromonospora deserti]|uniref:Pyridoxamine 5'-phosphate oxidase n=1 Tax=Micromonospora deserti TaxID=2070366 RepID=A0A2W2CPB5_9ACTN|nr:pyridoxamine 5'-phosphate oxidase family protein [Micromonospora deserti]PZG01356.1 pyridoxamine 5'-phosphate oxidase [Micromonospora deserti]
MTAPARSRQQRWKDTLHRLENDVDVWVATADPDGTPYLVPLSFLWDGDTLLLATLATSPTGRNLRDTGRVRLGIGLTRDVVLVDGTVETLTPDDLPDGVGDAFAAKTGFDPRRSTGSYSYFRVRPRRVQAWREEDEIAGRDLVRDGRRIVD